MYCEIGLRGVGHRSLLESGDDDAMAAWQGGLDGPYQGPRLITLAMATEIAASRRAVWRAVAEPEQAAHWRPGVTALLSDANAPLTRERVAEFRCQLHDLPVVLHERIIDFSKTERLESEVKLGLFHFRETFVLSDSTPRRTRLAIKIVTDSEMPVVGGSLDRFAVRRFATDLAATYLQAVRDWCERSVSYDAPLPEIPRGAVSVPG
jgi:hypothetical protein